MNMMMNMMLNMLRNKNPQAFNMINNAMSNGTNPQDLMKQVMGGKSPEQMQQIMQQAKQMGCPDSVLSQMQNMNS